jgi:hypothetical protein
MIYENKEHSFLTIICGQETPGCILCLVMAITSSQVSNKGKMIFPFSFSLLCLYLLFYNFLLYVYTKIYQMLAYVGNELNIFCSKSPSNCVICSVEKLRSNQSTNVYSLQLRISLLDRCIKRFDQI